MKTQSIRKQHLVILATHVAVISRDFILKDEVQQEKLDKYPGGNCEIQYIRNVNRMFVKHTFVHETYVIEFHVSYFSKI